MTITAAPFRLDSPSFVVDYDAAVGAAFVQLKCAGRNIDTRGDQDFEDTETFCTPLGEAPGAVAESIVVEVLNSLGVDGLWNQLKPLEGELVKFAYLPNGTVTSSPDNPEMSGELWVPYIPLTPSAGVRKFQTYSLEFKIFGIPTYDTTGAPVFASHS